MRELSVFDISGRAMAAQLVRLNATASNIANAGQVSGSAESAFRPLRPVFSVTSDRPGVATVAVDGVVATGAEPTRRHEPGHPLADPEGFVWESPVDPMVELVDLVEASRQYQNNIEVLQTAKTLTLDTLRIGQ